VYNGVVLVWFPNSFLCSSWRQVSSRCNKRQSYIRQQVWCCTAHLHRDMW